MSVMFVHQLPEPLMLFRLYNSLMGVAKESLQSEEETPEEAESGGTNPAVSKGAELVDLGPDTDPEVLVLVDKLKEHLKELPKANFATLRYIVRHLRRSVIIKILKHPMAKLVVTQQKNLTHLDKQSFYVPFLLKTFNESQK